MRPSSTARRYAQAAFDVAQEDGDVEAWITDLRTASERLQQGATADYFRDPSVDEGQKVRGVGELFAGMRPHVLNLLRTLASRQRLFMLPAVLEEFQALQRDARGILDIHVTVARPVDDRQRQDITSGLAQATGKQVEIHVDVDESIVGGVIVRIGDRLFDASIAGRLERLRQRIAI